MLLMRVVGLLCLLFSQNALSFTEGLYCGKEDCYSVLDVPRGASKVVISRTYRQLAKKYHPDKHKTPEAKNAAAQRFTAIVTAYEVLKDDESRRDYDYMLDHPDEIYGHYYRYYRRQVAPKVDVRIVIAVTITVISAVQYFSAWSRYRSAIDYLITVPKYRLKAIEIAKKEKLLDVNKKYAKRPKDQVKSEEEAILKKILEDKVDIRGGYSKPSIKDILWIQIICLPYTVARFICWNIWWIWKFNICKNPYGDEEKLYIIRKYLNCSKTQWEAISAEEKQEYLKETLWIREIFDMRVRKRR